MSQVVARDMTGSGAVSGIAESPKQVDNSNAGASVPEQTEAQSERFAALARQQKAQRSQQRVYEQQRQQFESERQAFAKERQELEQHKAELEQGRGWKQRIQSDPYGVLLESGLTADQVASLMLNQPNVADQHTTVLQRKVAELEAKLQKTDKTFQDTQEQQYQDAKKQIRNDVLMAVDADPAFETVKAMGAHDAVVELIEQTFTEDGRLMSVEEATAEVEEYLVQQALSIAGLGKIKSRLNPPAQVPQEPMKQQQVQKQGQTLSNRMVPQTTKSSSASERRQRAILAFQGKLS